MPFIDVINAFERDRGWVRYQIESFNNFIDYGLQKIIDEVGLIDIGQDGFEDFKIKFGKIRVEKPMVKEADGSVRLIFPNEARTRNLTYIAPMYVEIIPVFNGIQERSEDVHIGDLPIMVKSKLCNISEMSSDELIKHGEDPADPGGYFIVNGTERALVLIEEIASNKPIFEEGDDGSIKVRVNSERSGFKQRHLVEMSAYGEITISFANIHRLPIVVLLKALGVETDKAVCDLITSEERILNSFYINLFESNIISTEEAIDFIGRKLKISEDYRVDRVSQILDRYLLPHLGQESADRARKAKYIARIVKRTIKVQMGEAPKDDIDHYSNKRLLMSGDLLENLFRSILLGRWGLIAKMTYNYQKLIKRGKIPSLQSIIEANTVTKQILSSLATGNWIGGLTGVSQRLDRSSYRKTISHLRSVVSPLTTTQEHFRARQIHPTEWGRLCPAETPEGSSIGLRKHLALLSEITPGISAQKEMEIMKLVENKCK
ncbi:MAG: DNA-directed RNA polymerase subunit B'' [Candidatus Micrarchaeota archaeon]|nr:DNA-directed RNA polymerase subunit B'' [Candidatus Micrarchaeota archaeon]